MKTVFNDIAREFYLKKNFKQAATFVTQHLKLSPQDAEGWINLGKCYTNLELFTDAERAVETAISLNPNRADYLLDLQVLYSLTGEFDKYQPINERLARELPDEPRRIFNCAWDEMKAGNTFKGFNDLQAGRDLGLFGTDYGTFHPQKQLRKPARLKGKLVTFLSEGGMGDAILTARYVPLLKAAGAVVEHVCDKKLHDIFAHLSPCASTMGELISEHDYFITGFDAVCVFKRIPNEPYLFAKKPIKLPGTKKKVGIVWHGNIEYEWEQSRMVPKELLLSLASDKVELISLQRGESDQNLETWDDTLNLMAGLDAVVTSCTSVAHAAGALGKKTFVLSPLAPYYPWITKEKWYQDVTVFPKNKELGHAPAVERIRACL